MDLDITKPLNRLIRLKGENMNTEKEWQIIVTKRGRPETTLTYNDEDLIFCCDGEFEKDCISHIEYNVYINGELAQSDIAERSFNK